MRLLRIRPYMKNNTDTYKVAEKFVSINGESRLAGELAVFIRLLGCNLNCTYCDTAWAIPGDGPCELMNLDEIIEYVEGTGVKNVTITGGEPLLQPGLENLIQELISRNHKVEIETNGAISIKGLREIADNYSLTSQLSVTLDYKCPISGMEEFMLPENYDYLRKYDTVKFVVGDRTDLERAKKIIERYRLVEREIAVYLSPVFGSIASAEIVEYMIEHKMNGVRNQLQQHKFIWDPDKRGV